MKLRRVVLSLGFAALAARPAVAGTDDQKKEQIAAKQAAQDGFRVCNLTGQPVEVAKATYSAKRRRRHSGLRWPRSFHAQIGNLPVRPVPATIRAGRYQGQRELDV